jgi:hypothetical protein
VSTPGSLCEDDPTDGSEVGIRCKNNKSGFPLSIIILLVFHSHLPSGAGTMVPRAAEVPGDLVYSHHKNKISGRLSDVWIGPGTKP